MSIIEKIRNLATLEDNWDSYGAKPPQPAILEYGISLINQIFSPTAISPDVFPTPVGGIQFEWHLPNVDLEIEITPDQEVLVCFEDAENEWEDDCTNKLFVLKKTIDCLK